MLCCRHRRHLPDWLCTQGQTHARQSCPSGRQRAWHAAPCKGAPAPPGPSRPNPAVHHPTRLEFKPNPTPRVAPAAACWSCFTACTRRTATSAWTRWCAWVCWSPAATAPPSSAPPTSSSASSPSGSRRRSGLGWRGLGLKAGACVFVIGVFFSSFLLGGGGGGGGVAAVVPACLPCRAAASWASCCELQRSPRPTALDPLALPPPLWPSHYLHPTWHHVTLCAHPHTHTPALSPGVAEAGAQGQQQLRQDVQAAGQQGGQAGQAQADPVVHR